MHTTLQTSYQPGSFTTKNMHVSRNVAHTDGDVHVQVNFPEGSCGAVIGNKKLELLQFHFHTPSEHALNGRRYAMEAHLVHREIGTDNLTVLGVMIQRSKGAASNPALRKALDMAPEQGGKVSSPAPFMLHCILHCSLFSALPTNPSLFLHSRTHRNVCIAVQLGCFIKKTLQPPAL